MANNLWRPFSFTSSPTHSDQDEINPQVYHIQVPAGNLQDGFPCEQQGEGQGQAGEAHGQEGQQPDQPEEISSTSTEPVTDNQEGQPEESDHPEEEQLDLNITSSSIGSIELCPSPGNRFTLRDYSKTTTGNSNLIYLLHIIIKYTYIIYTQAMIIKTLAFEENLVKLHIVYSNQLNESIHQNFQNI